QPLPFPARPDQVPERPDHVTALALALALLAEAAGAPPASSWVVFDSPAFADQGLPHGGPPWRLSTPRLPAVDPAGGAVLVPRTEIVLGGAPNLTLAVLRVPDGAILSSHVLLTAEEFTAASQPAAGDGRTVARNFADLA